MARASAKAILLGEHAVVHGVPALAVGLDRGAVATATPSARSLLRSGGLSAAPGDGTDLGKAFEALLASLGAPPHAVEATLEVPAGVGLGASGALGVAVARAVLEATGEGGDLRRAVDAAMAWERVFHGNPSGVDAWAAALGGCLRFSRGEGPKPVPLPRPLDLVVAVTGPAPSTRAMVEGVARLLERRREMVEKAFEGIRSLVDNAALCLEAGDWPGLGKLLDLAQMLLSGLMLSTPEIERACGIARSAGALGAKLTGAGGGGCIIALADGPPETVARALRAASFESFTARVA